MIDNFNLWCTKYILPIAYDESLSYYQQLILISDKLNEVIDSQNNLGEQFQQLKEFVDKQLQTYTKEQLQEWLDDGTFRNLINNALGIITVFDTTEQMLASTSLQVGQTVQTNGYYEVGDGGGARFVVTNEENNLSLKSKNNLFCNIVDENITLNKLGGKKSILFDSLPIAQKIIDEGHTLIIEEGEYNFNGILNLKTNSIISGNGRPKINCNGVNIVSTSSSPYSQRIRYVTIENIEFNGLTIQSPGIVIQNFGYITLNNVRIHNFNVGLSIISGSEMYIENSEIYGNNQNIYILRNNDAESDIANVFFNVVNISNANNSIGEIYNARSCYFNNCSIVNSGKGGLTINSSLNLRALLITFENCQFENASEIASVKNNGCENIKFYNCTQSPSGNYSFENNYGLMTFTNCIFSAIYAKIFLINGGEIRCTECNIKYWYSYIQDNTTTFKPYKYPYKQLNLNPFFAMNITDFQSSGSGTWESSNDIITNGGKITYQNANTIIYNFDNQSINETYVEIYASSINSVYGVKNSTQVSAIRGTVQTINSINKYCVFINDTIDSIVLTLPSGASIIGFIIFNDVFNRTIPNAYFYSANLTGNFANGQLFTNKSSSYPSYGQFIYIQNGFGVTTQKVTP